jgi:predicted metal-dependent hydrolase
MRIHASHSVIAADPLPTPISKEQLKTEVAEWADRVGVRPAEIRITGLRTKWASCSTRGRVTFDAALLSQPSRVRTEVIIHELLHLSLPDHGPLFRARLRTYLARSEVTTRAISRK